MTLRTKGKWPGFLRTTVLFLFLLVFALKFLIVGREKQLELLRSSSGLSKLKVLAYPFVGLIVQILKFFEAF